MVSFLRRRLTPAEVSEDTRTPSEDNAYAGALWILTARQHAGSGENLRSVRAALEDFRGEMLRRERKTHHRQRAMEIDLQDQLSQLHAKIDMLVSNATIA